ncbi:hypothetical protein ONS95_013590 [Cadophora gregata]|uniref:uncharacterized protein n=1 Tax=Cadophora gregata TaxID=51156 RepID=UPI0026DBFAD1|nr:uncharacterized protein ONS95_013590 [Cadophora gregata]KAK0113334.1 hypothetical protein ONS96_014199 [Cadophora gregata f. sp. sojae]KAK0114085.1 hypothetical protein ONS95_013590 [Cadophora gregata]
MSSNSTNLLLPPGGDQPDDSRGPAIIAAVTITTISALATVILRLWVRIKIVRSVGPEDYVMIGAVLLSVTGWLIVIPQVMHGAGRHVAYLDPEVVKIGLKLNFVTQPIYLIATTASKVSIALFLLRIASTKIWKRFLWALLGFMILYTSAAVMPLFFQCKNLAVLWDSSVVTTCWSAQTSRGLGYMNVVLTIITDLTLALIPIPMLWNVQINSKVKISIIGIMSLGLFASAAAIVRATALSNYGKTGDFLRDSTDLTIWGATEVNVGIIAACLPCLKPVFKKILESSSWYTSNNRSTGYGAKQNSSHKMKIIRQGYRESTNQHSVISIGTRRNRMQPGDLENNVSEETILPIQMSEDPSKITRTTVVTIARTSTAYSDKDNGLGTGKTAWPGGPSRQVEDRF